MGVARSELGLESGSEEEQLCRLIKLEQLLIYKQPLRPEQTHSRRTVSRASASGPRGVSGFGML